MFFYIGNTTFYQLRKPRVAPSAAVRLKLSDTFIERLKMSTFAITFVLLITAALPLTIDSNEGKIRTVLSLILTAIVLVLMFVAIPLDYLKGVRQKLLDGEYRQYFVSSQDASFDIVFSASMRESFERNLDIRRKVRELFDTLFTQDWTIGRKLPQTLGQEIVHAEARLSIIVAAKELHERLGIDSEKHFEMEQDELYLNLETSIRNYEQELQIARTIFEPRG